MCSQYGEFAASAEALLLSPELQELKSIVEFKTPNLWNIVGISRREVEVTRFLAWLIDPKSGHSLGDSFLKKLLVRALQANEGQRLALRPVEILLMDFADIQVKREYWLGSRRCDIALWSEAAGFLCIF